MLERLSIVKICLFFIDCKFLESDPTFSYTVPGNVICIEEYLSVLYTRGTHVPNYKFRAVHFHKEDEYQKCYYLTYHQELK